MPTANYYTPPPTPYIGPAVKTPVDVTPGVATGTNPPKVTITPPVANTPPITPGVATSTEPPPPLPPPQTYDLEISNVIYTDNPVTAPATPNLTIQGNSIIIAVDPKVLNFTGTGVSTTSSGNGVVNVTINSSNTRSAGMPYAVQWAGANGTFAATSNFAFDPVNKMVKIGIAQLQAPYDLNLNGNLIVGQIYSQTGFQPFGASYAEFGRIRYLDDAGFPSAGIPSVYGFRCVTNPYYENWMCIVNEPGHEYNTSSAIVLGVGLANGPDTLFGVSVNSTNPKGSNTNGIYSDPKASGWKKVLNLTGQDLFLPQLTDAVGPKTLAYDPSNGRVTYTNGAAGSSITIKDEGTNVVVNTNTINFVGNGVVASNVFGVATITIPGGSSGITVKDEGSNVLANTTSLNFVGAGVTASNVGNVATITIPGGSSGITVRDEGTNVLVSANILNFVGAGVTASNVGGIGTITIPGGSSGITVRDEGTNVLVSANILNFVGNGVVASNVSGVATITINSSGISGITVKDEGTNVVSSANTFNFVGAGVTTSNVGGVATVTIPGGGSGITVQDEGTNVVASANKINFVGSAVTASNVGGVATVTINSTGGNIGTDPYQLVFANNTGIASSSPLLTIQNPTYNSEGAALQIGASQYSTGGGTTTQGMLYFTDSAESSVYPYPSASIRYQYGGSTFDKGIKISPWYNYSGSTNFASGVGLGAWRRANQASTHGTKVTLNAGDTGAGLHGVYIGQGAVDFFPDYGTGNSAGLSYIILPAAFTANGTTDRYVGQISVNAYKNPGVPQWALGWKDSDALNPSESNERTPGNRNIIWDSNNHVSINDADLTESFNVKGNISIQATGANSGTGIKFADGTFQYTAATGGGGITIVQEEGTNVITNANTINFVGTGVTASNVGGVATITINDTGNTYYGGYYLHTQTVANTVWNVTHNLNRQYVTVEPVDSTGNSYTGRYDFPTIHYINANALTMTWSSAISGFAAVVGGGINDGGTITIQDEGTNVVASANVVNFVGAGVTTSNVGGVATVTIPGGGSSVDTIYDLGYVSGNVNLSVTNGTIQTCILNGDTYFNLAGVTSGESITLIITQGGGGPWIAYWSGVMRWAAGYKTLSTAEGSIDMVNMVNVNYIYYSTLTTGYTA